ncbi:hypothetical protein ACHAXA_000379 [Cyclostephanos tholiformis]|uniref:Uncharacterized protein n=1 Tax=Cyclostephanos tholiformis TaxID=382380 RepID=A0ABD3R1C3_9STRA
MKRRNRYIGIGNNESDIAVLALSPGDEVSADEDAVDPNTFNVTTVEARIRQLETEIQAEIARRHTTPVGILSELEFSSGARGVSTAIDSLLHSTNEVATQVPVEEEAALEEEANTKDDDVKRHMTVEKATEKATERAVAEAQRNAFEMRNEATLRQGHRC